MMPSSPSSSAQAARVRLGSRLRELRVGAGLTGREFAARAGWRSAANVTKIEKGRYTITADTVRLWCAVCEAPQALTAELLAEHLLDDLHVCAGWFGLSPVMDEMGSPLTRRWRRRPESGRILRRVPSQT